MTTGNAAITIIDLQHLGRRQVIGACLLEGPGQCALLDPGPASTLPILLEGLDRRGVAPEDVRDVVLTHVHLDHAGATGHLASLNPDLRVYVHERGAAHVIDPSKLVRSARRLWPDNLDTLWGEPLPTPAKRVTTLAGSEQIHVAGHRLEVADTPGHASHHLCYLDPDSGTAFTGDTAGVRIAGTAYVNPPTPPPDIDVDAWLQSLDTIAAWQPACLIATHFGRHTNIAEHVLQLRNRLGKWAARVRAGLASDDGGDAGKADFCAMVEAEVRAHLDEATAEAVLQATPPVLSWLGLARYWRRR